MGDAYPELRREQQRVTDVLKQEEERFFQTIANGMEILEAALASLPARARPHPRRRHRLQAARHLRLPARPHRRRLPRARRRGRHRRLRGGDGAAARAGARRRQVQGRAGAGVQRRRDHLPRLRAAGPRQRHGARALRRRQRRRARPGPATTRVVVLDHTPFYAESGGQVGDTGELRNATARFLVEDTVKIQAAVFGHEGRVVEGEIKVGDTARRQGRRRAARAARCATTAPPT